MSGKSLVGLVCLLAGIGLLALSLTSGPSAAIAQGSRSVAADASTEVFAGTSRPASPSVPGSAAWALDLLPLLDVTDEPPPVPYERDDYDNGWQDVDGDCQSARHEVLIIESAEPVAFTDASECKVEVGLWNDPYAPIEMRLASEASIDHVVSLANAHRSGAANWTTERKRAFANDLDDPATLAVSAPDINGQKGSAGPEDWLPNDPFLACSYAIDWVRIKTRWELSVNSAELAALVDVLADCPADHAPAPHHAVPFRIVTFDNDVERPEQAIAAGDPDRCDPAYPSVCIPVSAIDLDCADVEPEYFPVESRDPHGFDGDDDGIGCETPAERGTR